MLGVIEIAIFLLVSALLIVNADQNTLNVFLPGADGVRPAFQGMIFCLLAFIGFEAAAPLGEETREPRRTIPRAVIWSAVLIGAFYVFNYYAATVFFGPDRMTEFYTFNDGDPWGFMAEEVLPGIGGLLIIFAILNSSLANANSGATAATRTLFAMGRVRLLPRWFAAVHPEHARAGERGPLPGDHARSSSRSSSGVILANDPYPTPEGAGSFGGLNVYVFLGTMLGLIFVFIYICVNLACIGYFWRVRRDHVQPDQAPRRARPRGDRDDPGRARGHRRPHDPDPGHRARPVRERAAVHRADRRDLDADRHRPVLRPARPESRGARANGRCLRRRGAVADRPALTDRRPMGRPRGRLVGAAYSKIPSGQ